MYLIITILVSALTFFLAAKLLSGVTVKSFTNAIIIAIVIAILNATLGPVLKVFSLGILTLGLFKLVLDAILIKVADYFLDGLAVKNFWWALILAAVVAIIDSVLTWIL